jgi:hypothetical protein
MKHKLRHGLGCSSSNFDPPPTKPISRISVWWKTIRELRATDSIGSVFCKDEQVGMRTSASVRESALNISPRMSAIVSHGYAESNNKLLLLFVTGTASVV